MMNTKMIITYLLIDSLYVGVSVRAVTLFDRDIDNDSVSMCSPFTHAATYQAEGFN